MPGDESHTRPKLPTKQLAILGKHNHCLTDIQTPVARFAEPMAYTSVFPYLPERIRDFGVEQNKIAKWAGITSAVFSLAQSITAVPWGRAADRYGRKPILVLGLFTTMICFVIWGMSTSLHMAIAVRAIQGGSNGNVGIIRTMVAEMVPEKELQPRAFSIMPLVWSLGSVVGPSFGGMFAQPAKQYPSVFGNIEYFKRFPYALPNLLATVFFLISLTSASLFLQETLAEKKEGRDWGLLVGQRLTRAFKKRPTITNRRSSFVDGEATAPLVPSRSMSNKNPPSSAGMREVFTYQTLLNLLAYSFLAFHSVAYDQNITVFLDYPLIEDTGSKVKLPFYFSGGFGLSAGRIGTIFTLYGITCGLVQFLGYPPLVNKFGVLKSLRICSVLVPFVYLLTPYTALFPTETSRFVAILFIMFLKGFCIIVAFPSTTILLTNSCTSLRILGMLNGFATSFSGLGRALGPATTGIVFSWGADNGYVISAYWFLALIAAIGAIPIFMIVEGDGPTASSSAEPSDSEDSDATSDSSIFLPNESAILDESDDDERTIEASPTTPLLKKSGPDYFSISKANK